MESSLPRTWPLKGLVACGVILILTLYWSWPSPGNPSAITETKWKSPGNSTLIIVNGQIRGGILCWKSFKRHMLDHYQADLALVKPFERENDEVVHWEGKARYILKVKEHEDWGPELTRINRGNGSWEIILLKANENFEFELGGVRNHNGSAGILLAYRYYARVFLGSILEIESYHWVIFVRSDYVYLCSPPPVISLDPRAIYVPDCEHYGGVSDRFTIMTAEKADLYLGITEDILAHGELWRDRIRRVCGYYTNFECLIKAYLQHHAVEVGFFSPVSFTVRRKIDPFRWSDGNNTSRFGESFGLQLKYPNELHFATETCAKIMGRSNVNFTRYLTQMLHSIS